MAPKVSEMLCGLEVFFGESESESGHSVQNVLATIGDKSNRKQEQGDDIVNYFHTLCQKYRCNEGAMHKASSVK